MAIAVQLDLHGATLEQYDRINEEFGLLPGGPASRSEIFHWVAATDNGVRVVDVWESREAFDAFAREKLAPILQEVGVPQPPEMQFFEVHNYLVGRPRNR
jgi:hypothetical protein